MENHKAIRPPKKRTPLPPVSKPDTGGTENKYARRTLIGGATIGTRPNKVTSIGLGNLTVETATNGDTNVRPY